MIKKVFKVLKNNIILLYKIIKCSNKSFLCTLYEIIKYEKKYQINVEDYYSFQFYNMTEEQVSTFFTYKMNDKIIEKCNENSKKKLFNNKELFDIIFNNYLGRKWIKSDCSFNEFKNFLGQNEEIFYKKIGGSRGIGAKKIKKSDYTDLNHMYLDIKKMDIGILEEIVCAHKSIREICDSGLSTIRLITYNKNGKLILVDSVFMLVNGGIINCEVTGGGLSACIDVNTGKVITDAVDVNRVFYKKHPMSNVIIKGFQIPYWDEVKKLASEVFNKVPGVNYIGWDIAITDNGPIIIEGNASWPSHRIWQVPYLKDKKGKKQQMEKIFNE